MKERISLKAAIEIIKPKQFLRLEPVSPRGSLELRKSPKAAFVFYFRFTYNGKPDRVQIGLYDKLAPPKSVSPTERGYSLAAARSAAAAMSERHYKSYEEGGLRAVLVQEKAEIEAQHNATIAAAAAKGNTLEKLMGVYIESLRNPNTAKDTRNSFNKNVKAAFPDVSSTQANQVTTEQIATVLRKILGKGHKTTARQLRAYLHSAFEQARKIDRNPAASEKFAPFNVKHNPVTDVSSIPNSNGADKNPILPEMMRQYWKLISGPGKEAAFLRLHLLLGGQRLEQLIRLKNADITPDAIVLEDTKGRAGNIRFIVVPLIAAAADALSEIRCADGEFALSVTPGQHVSTSTIRRWSKAVVGKSIEGYTLKRVRSGVTTLLAKLKVSQELRDELQSHGLSGVEKRHYNMYEYFEEKKEALEKMFDFLHAPDDGREPARRRQLEARPRKATGIAAWKAQKR
ncbi:MAG: integrase [Candidimonas sp.]|nr:integrase [Candidimonas sp.]